MLGQSGHMLGMVLGMATVAVPMGLSLHRFRQLP